MPQADSIDKIVDSYFSVVTDEDFEYKGKLYKKKPIVIRTNIFRGFTCPINCGGCCHHRFSLDYLPGDPHPYELQERIVEFNNRSIRIYSDLQNDHKNNFCKNLNLQNGRCNVHGKQPFSCDFELIRSIKFDNPERSDTLTTKLFGRGWAMMRVDGVRGARCEILPVSHDSLSDTIRKLERLKDWCLHFQLRHRVDQILDWAGSPKARMKDLYLSEKKWKWGNG